MIPSATFSMLEAQQGTLSILIVSLTLLGVLIIREMSATIQRPMTQRLKQATLVVLLPFSIIFLITLVIQVGTVH